MYKELCRNVLKVVAECYYKESDLPLIIRKAYDIITITDCLKKELRKMNLDGLDEFEKTIDQLNEKLLKIAQMDAESEEELLEQDEKYQTTFSQYITEFTEFVKKTVEFQNS